MTDSRKFPLFLLLISFVAGLLLESYLQWTARAGVAFLILSALVLPFSLRDQLLRRISLHLLFFSVGLLVFRFADYRHDTDNVIHETGDSVILLGEVRERKPGIAGRQQLLLAVSGSIHGDSIVPKTGRVVVDVMDDSRRFVVGDKIVVSGDLDRITNKNNPGEFDAVWFYRNRKVSGHIFASGETVRKTGEIHNVNYWMTLWRDQLAAKMEAELDGQFLAIAKALILGDKSDLDNELLSSFSSTGSMHVLAVSGLHIGLILLMLQKVLELFSRWITKRQGLLIAIILIWIYGGITGASPAVMRAVVMFTVLTAAQLSGRRNDALNGLALSALILLTFDPWMLFDLGFQLSYAAMLGIFLLYRPIADAFPVSGKLGKLTWEGTAVGIAATITTVPLTLFWFYQFPNYFALANLGVMVFGFAVLLMGLVLLTTGWVPLLIKLVAVFFSFSVLALVLWVNWIDGLPGAVSGGFQLPLWSACLAYALIVLWIVHLQRRVINRWAMIAASLLLIGFWTVNRQEVLKSRQWIVFNSNQFTAVYKSGPITYGFYEQKWNGSWKEPRELKAFATYSGTDLRVIKLVKPLTTLKSGKTALRLERKKDRYLIQLDKNRWEYLKDGVPDPQKEPGLMTTRLQQYLNPGVAGVPFVRRFY